MRSDPQTGVDASMGPGTDPGVDPGMDNRVDTLPVRVSNGIFACFESYDKEFGRITRQAAKRFTEREWKLGQRDAIERIELYDRRIEKCVAGLVGQMGPRVADRNTWQSIKIAFSDRVDGCPNNECFKTFFNSITRKIFNTIGVNADVEFVAFDVQPGLDIEKAPTRKTDAGDPGQVAARILSLFPGTIPAGKKITGIDKLLGCISGFRTRHDTGPAIEAEFLEPVFFRSTRGFLVGRLLSEGCNMPLVVALKSNSNGAINCAEIDAVITDSNVISSLFGFSRSYFHVDVSNVGGAVAFLGELMPLKPIDEIYTVLGRARQGKTERFRNLYRHLEHSSDEFVHADGEKGMVMIVFALPSHDIVFKVIRDRFAPPKETSRREVMQKYRFVFRHDRVGRLVDAQEFRRLRLPRERFSELLLHELLAQSSDTCRLAGDDLIIDHCYIERRLRPLNLYLREADKHAAQRAVIDYGQAVKDLAMSNVFPGDLLLKNFGVSRSGRVIFYDYDELCLVTDCVFRELPSAQHDEDEYRSEPWFYVGKDDVFPEEITDFLGFSPELRDVFLLHHRDLVSSKYWRNLKQCHNAEEHLEIIPYPTPSKSNPVILKAGFR